MSSRSPLLSDPLDSGFDSLAPSAPKTRGSKNDKGTLDRPSIYVFAKTPQIKKPDGKPLLRKDIQYALLTHIFRNDQKVFTSSYDASLGKLTFSQLYVESMSRSSKCSRVVREKLLSDNELAIRVAMVSLLVNVGKMNTTLTFFPEMRAQLRTYHPIPSLQSGQEQDAKLLQDAPRIKSILKGVQEDRNEPFTWEQLLECRKRGLKPLTSPVSLIFLFGTYCQKMTELHFSPPREFYDLFNRTSLSSESRARAFLWLCWHYLETDGSPDAANFNPFGPTELPGSVRVPKLYSITPDQENAENLDPEEEIEYGRRMEEERRRYLDNELYNKDKEQPDKTSKKARGGVASRKAKTSSMVAHASRTKTKSENQDPNQSFEEESPHSKPSSKVGDLSFVLNAPAHSPPKPSASKSPSYQKQPSQAPAPSFVETGPGFTSGEPAHNLRVRTKKRKVESSAFDDYMMEPWDEPDEAGYSEEEARRELVEKEIRRRIKRDFKKRRRERFKVGGVTREWNFIQTKLGSVLQSYERLDAASNESDGGEECEALLTALRRVKRRADRRKAKQLEEKDNETAIKSDSERAMTGGKTLPNLKLTLNGY